MKGRYHAVHDELLTLEKTWANVARRIVGSCPTQSISLKIKI